MTDSHTPSPTIGVIGLGRMGRAIAGRLSAAGWTVCGWTRSGIAGSAAGGLGIGACGTMAELAEKSGIVILSLMDDRAVTDVVRALCRLDLTGRLVVDTSTVSPETLRGEEEAIRAAGGAAIDAPVSGGPETVLAGTAGLYIGGAEADVARFMPLAEALSDRIVHVGGLGAGAAAKIVNNMVLAGYWETLKEALQVGKRSGLGIETMMEVLSRSPAASPAFLHRSPVILGTSEAVGFPVTGVIKDTALFVETARKAGVEAPAMAAALQSFLAHRDAGHGEEDLATMVRAAYLEA